MLPDYNSPTIEYTEWGWWELQANNIGRLQIAYHCFTHTSPCHENKQENMD